MQIESPTFEVVTDPFHIASCAPATHACEDFEVLDDQCRRSIKVRVAV